MGAPSSETSWPVPQPHLQQLTPCPHGKAEDYIIEQAAFA